MFHLLGERVEGLETALVPMDEKADEAVKGEEDGNPMTISSHSLTLRSSVRMRILPIPGCRARAHVHSSGSVKRPSEGGRGASADDVAVEVLAAPLAVLTSSLLSAWKAANGSKVPSAFRLLTLSLPWFLPFPRVFIAFACSSTAAAGGGGWISRTRLTEPGGMEPTRSAAAPQCTSRLDFTNGCGRC